eukprot:gene2094-3203_t
MAASDSGSESGSDGSFDNDTTLGSFVEDLTYFCTVLESLSKVAGGSYLRGPFSACKNSAEDVQRHLARLAELAEEHKDTQEVMTRDSTGELVDLCGAVVPDFHTALLNWHCGEFYPFHEKFSVQYAAYVRAFLANIAEDFRNTFTLQHERDYFLSAYTYSHRVKGAAVNHGRLSFGVAYTSTPALTQAAQAVLTEQNITLPPEVSDLNGTFKFYGLGWDYDASPAHVKFYVHGESKDLPKKYKEQKAEANGFITGEFEDHVLIAFTLACGTGEVLEEKLYLYPSSPKQVKKEKHEVPSGVLNAACVVANGRRRGTFWQYDVTHTPHPECDCPLWRERFNEVGKAIYDKYHAQGMRLDTLAFAGSDDFTAYFPFEP